MTADEIMHVLRLTAMGRVNHPDQQRLCEALEKVFASAFSEQVGDGHIDLIKAALSSEFPPAPKKRAKKAD